MATELNPKKVILSQIKEDLESGLTRWKKDDIGFGSLEKKYSLTLQEMCQLLAHPKIKDIETKIPVFIILDDIEDIIIEAKVETTTSEINSNATEREAIIQVQKSIIIKAPQEEKKYEAFI